jgi:hypothetical protein
MRRPAVKKRGDQPARACLGLECVRDSSCRLRLALFVDRMAVERVLERVL